MKKIFVVFLFTFIIISFIVCPTISINASKNGIMLWFNKIFPILFPCIIVSNVLLGSNIIENHIKIIPHLIILCGFLCGFPIGSKLSTDFYKKKFISKDTAQCLCNYTNQLSLAYINGFVIPNCINDDYNKANIYFLLYAPAIVFLIYSLSIHQKKEVATKKTASRFKLNMQIIDAGIISGFETLIKLCGYIVIFSIIVEVINSFTPPSYYKYILTGIIENTTGLSQLINSPFNSSIKLILAVGFTTFGGISCIIQTASIINDTNLSIKKYVLAKITTSVISILLTCIYLLGIRFS